MTADPLDGTGLLPTVRLIRRRRVVVPPSVPGITDVEFVDAAFDESGTAWDTTTGALLDHDTDQQVLEEGEQALPTGRELRRLKAHRTLAESAAYVRTYTPRPDHDAHDSWASLAPVLRPAALRLCEFPNMTGAVEVSLDALMRIGHWHVTTVGPVTDIKTLLAPDTLERWLAHHAITHGLNGSLDTHRSRIRRIGPLLWPDGPYLHATAKAVPRISACPYLLRQMAVLRVDAEQQSTLARRRFGEAAEVLGAGAGLDGRWASDVLATDVIDDGSGLRIWVGEPDRKVPVLNKYVTRLRHLVDTTPPGMTLFGLAPGDNKNRLTVLLRDFAQEDADATDPWAAHPKFDLRRLRATWLTHHLAAGTRLPELLAAAGLMSLSALDGLVQYVDPLQAEDAIKHVAGARVRR